MTVDFLQVTLDDVENVSNPIEKEKLGLLPSNASDSRFTVSLQEVHIRARLVDMAAEVNQNTIFVSFASNGCRIKKPITSVCHLLWCSAFALYWFIGDFSVLL